MQANLHNSVGLPQEVLEEIRTELNDALGVINSDAILKDIFERIVYTEPTVMSEVAACAIPILDFSSINDLRLDKDEVVTNYSYGLKDLVTAEPTNPEQGGGWLLTPLEQIINPSPTLEQTTTIRDTEEFRSIRGPIVANKFSKNSSRKTKPHVNHQNVLTKDKPDIVTDPHAGRSIYSIGHSNHDIKDFVDLLKNTASIHWLTSVVVHPA